MCKSDSGWILKPYHHINSIMTSITLGSTRSGITGGLCVKCTAVFGPSHAVAWLCLTAGWQIRSWSVRRCRFGHINRFPRTPTWNLRRIDWHFWADLNPRDARNKKNKKITLMCFGRAYCLYCISPIYPSGVRASCVLTLWVALPIQQMLPMISASCAVWWPSRYASPLCVQSAQWLCQQLASPNALLCFGHSNVGQFIWKSPFKGSLVSFFFVISGLCSYVSVEGRRIFSPLSTVFQ